MSDKPIRTARSKAIIQMERMWDRCLALVEREITHLEGLSIVNKLGAAYAKDLRDYVKLIHDMKSVQLAREAERRKKVEAKTAQLSEEALEAVLRVQANGKE
jgi:hypothetical protein